MTRLPKLQERRFLDDDPFTDSYVHAYIDKVGDPQGKPFNMRNRDAFLKVADCFRSVTMYFNRKEDQTKFDNLYSTITRFGQAMGYLPKTPES